MRLRLVVTAAVAVIGSAAVAVGIAPAQPAHTAAAKTTVNVHKGKLGTFLVTSNGMTLYLWEKDKGGKSACTGDCAMAWPPLLASGKPVAGKGVTASKLGTTRRSDGKTQVTYGGHPLYTFVKDTKAGQTAGEGVDGFGAEWYVVAPSGKAIDDD